MNSQQWLKLTGFLGAVFAAASTAIGGDYVTAGGLIAAALSSASGLRKHKRDEQFF